MKTVEYGKLGDQTWLQSTMMVIAALMSLVFAFQIFPVGLSAAFDAARELKKESIMMGVQDSGSTSVDPASTSDRSDPQSDDIAEHSPYPERAFSSKHVFQLVLIGTLIIWGYSLVMAGKHGQGWAILILVLGILKYIGRFIRSLFVEVTAKNEVRDWDDD